MHEWEIVHKRKSPDSTTQRSLSPDSLPPSPPIMVDAPAVTSMDVDDIRRKLDEFMRHHKQRITSVMVDNPMAGASRSLPSSPIPEGDSAAEPRIVVMEIASPAPPAPPAPPASPASPAPPAPPANIPLPFSPRAKRQSLGAERAKRWLAPCWRCIRRTFQPRSTSFQEFDDPHDSVRV